MPAKAPAVVHASALIERHVWAAGSFFPRLEYLQCKGTWTTTRRDAQVFGDYLEADALARKLSTKEQPVFAAIVQRPRESEKMLPARERRSAQIHEHDWREDVPNCGVA